MPASKKTSAFSGGSTPTPTPAAPPPSTPAVRAVQAVASPAAQPVAGDTLGARLKAISDILVGADPSTISVGAAVPTVGEPMPAAAPGSVKVAADYGEGNDAVYQKYASAQLASYGWGQDEMGALIELWNRESGWNPAADNPTSTAYGIAQFLDSTWAGTGIARTADPYQQINAGLIYIRNRYGSPSAALAWHNSNNWY